MSQYTILVIEHRDQPASNWPSFYPILYHDIATDFNDENTKKLLRWSYFLCKLYIAMLLVHSCADIALAILLANIAGVLAQLIGSTIYLILMPVGDFFGRHLSLYIAFKHNSESSFRYYFVGEAIVIIFGLIIALEFIFSSGTLGIIRIFQAKLYIPGVLIVIFLLLVLVQTIFHIILTILVYRIFRSRNFTICPRRNISTTSATIRRN